MIVGWCDVNGKKDEESESQSEGYPFTGRNEVLRVQLS